MTVPFYEEKTYALDLAQVGNIPLADLISEYQPEEEGWELFGQHPTAAGHPNINKRLFGSKELLLLTWRKYRQT